MSHTTDKMEIFCRADFGLAKGRPVMSEIQEGRLLESSAYRRIVVQGSQSYGNGPQKISFHASIEEAS